MHGPELCRLAFLMQTFDPTIMLFYAQKNNLVAALQHELDVAGMWQGRFQGPGGSCELCRLRFTLYRVLMQTFLLLCSEEQPGVSSSMN